MDQSGEQILNVEEHTIKQRISADGELIGKEYIQDEESSKQIYPVGYCGSCFGAGNDGECCNSCSDLKRAYSRKGWDSKNVVKQADQCKRANDPSFSSKLGEGCRIAGYMETNRVNGNFHIAMGDSMNDNERHIHLFKPGEASHYNISHIIREYYLNINRLSFGDPYPGIYNPLSNTEYITESSIFIII